MEYMRVWKEIDIEEVKNHIIMVEDKYGHCPGCKQIGIELKELGKCPGCGRVFKYATSLNMHPSLIKQSSANDSFLKRSDNLNRQLI